jgi:ornithine cyclodeaminase/alanine dehydrogenase-like protein (mu-crystallin family)
MILVDSNTIGNAAPIEKWVSAMESAFRDTANGLLDVPQRMHIDRGQNTLLLMPCFGEEYFSTKLVSVFPENQLKKKPVIYGTVVLNDGRTGKPLAVMDGGKLTAMRTAAVGAVGIKYLAPEDASRLGIIGLGIQGFHQALFACQQRPVRLLSIIDHSRKIMSRFAERFNAYYPDIKVLKCVTARDLCQDSDIIITATGSHQPVVPGTGAWWKGKTLIGIGSYKPDMKEFPDEIFEDVDQVYVDTLHANAEAGDLVDPIRKGLIREKDVLPIADLILKKATVSGGTRFFKSVGMAAFDLYGAKLVYECIKS